MRFFIQLFAILLLAFLFEMFFPWWWGIALAAALGGYLFKSDYNFLSGFMALFILWLITAYFLEYPSAKLTEAIANLFQINTILLLVVTSFVGGLVGGMASLTGSLLKRRKKKLYY